MKRQWPARQRKTTPPEIQDIQDLETLRGLTDLKHRDRYASRLLTFLGCQLVVTNVLFALYAWLGMKWKVPSETIAAYLASVTVELIGLVYVVVRYLFPDSTPAPVPASTPSQD